MKILHITDIYNPSGNGVAVAVKYYLKYESKNNEIAIYNLNSNIETNIKNVFNKKDYNSINNLPMNFDKPDLVIFNEVYKKEYIKLYKYCLKNKIKYIIIPHGCLVDTAQKRKKLKKIIGNTLLFNKFIKNATAIQFLNIDEKNKSKFRYKKAIISGNGVDDFSERPSNNYCNDLVYIGRYSIYHKGLDKLVDICVQNKKWFIDNNIKIQLYGRTSANDLDILNKMIKENKIENIIIVNGAVFGDEKKKILLNSYAFIQISRHEGQPMGIVEALALGIPCIVTKGTNFADFVNETKSGIGVNFDDKEIFKAIKKIYINKNERQKYALNAINSTKKYFYWEQIINELLVEYEKIVKE